MPEPTTHTLAVPGAVLTYDVRPSDPGTGPVLLLIGSPMGAAGFGTLAGYFANRTVVTYDPRGVERSQRTDGATESTPDEHADDLHRLIAALGAGPVDIFASSGGAVNALALVARHPEQVRTLVAHEPPAAQVVPDREAAMAATAAIHETYLRRGLGPAMAKFFALASHTGPIPADFASRPAPDPAMFGLPTEDDGSRDDPLLGQNIVSCTHYEPAFDALREASTRIVIAAGAESEGELAHRAAVAIAERLGTAPATFPGGHGGFLGGEYGQMGAPEAFAATLREVLAAAAGQREGDEEIDQPGADRLRSELDRFVGEWTMTAAPPGGPPWPGAARVRFEWLDGGAFLVERWSLDASGLPEGTPTSGTSVYGCDAAHRTYVQLYHDDRGVCRVYEMGLRGGEWTLRREGPPFAQRFTGTFSADGATIAGRWEIAEEGRDWRTDFDVTYTRVS